MFNDETQVDDLENTSEDTQEEETVETTESSETTPDWEAEAKKWKAIAERKAKKLEQPKPEQKETPSSLSEDDILVITELKDKKLIDSAREIAKLKGISLPEAVNTTMFKLAKQEIEEETRKEKASMEASRGSGSRGQRKSFATPGLSKEEHKELFLKRSGR